VHKRAEVARNSIGLKGKMLTKKRHAEKAQMKKTIAMHEEKDSKRKADDGAPQNAVPAYLLEREQVCVCVFSLDIVRACVCVCAHMLVHACMVVMYVCDATCNAIEVHMQSLACV